jgi:hypothetical protein
VAPWPSSQILHLSSTALHRVEKLFLYKFSRQLADLGLISSSDKDDSPFSSPPQPAALQ